MRITKLSTLLITVLTCCQLSAQAESQTDLYDGLPFQMDKVKEPVIPQNTVSITDFGGNPNGKTLNTEAFAKAIKHLSDLGGGRLEVPFGVWYTGPIELKSRIELHLEKGALVLFQTIEPTILLSTPTSKESVRADVCRL